MLLTTKYLGDIEINEEKIIHFQSGLPGFTEENQFIIIDLPENDLIKILQSVITPDLAFIITNPHYFHKHYEFTLDESTIETLEIKDENDVAVFSIMTLKDPFKDSTINLQAPIIINSRQRLGKQYVINESKYAMRFSISSSSVKGSD